MRQLTNAIWLSQLDGIGRNQFRTDADRVSSGNDQVRSRYADGSQPIDYGLIAEEVAEVYPDLVATGADGQPETVQYQKLTPMLLNELQKQHQQMEQQAEMIRQLEMRLTKLEAK